MNKASMFIDFKNIMSSEYSIDILKIPNAICEIAKDISITRKYAFMQTPSTESQAEFADIMVQNKFDVITLDYSDKAMNVALSTKLISDAYKNTFDIGVILSGSTSLYPAIKETRLIGKQIMICNFSDKISSIYKELNYETGPLDFDILYLDEILDYITDNIITKDINEKSIMEEVKNDFFTGNLDYSKINVKKYIAYWATRARFLQINQESMNKDDQETIRKMFDKLNDLSSNYQPGYVKSLNKKWSPESWENEIRSISKVW